MKIGGFRFVHIGDEMNDWDDWQCIFCGHYLMGGVMPEGEDIMLVDLVATASEHRSGCYPPAR